MGYKSEAHANESIVIGDTAKAENGTNNAIVFGKNATVKENITGAVAIGKNAKVETSANDAIALGSNSVANTAGDITGFDTVTGKVRTGTDVNAYGAWKSKYGALSIGNVNDTRQITGVAAGKQDTDAVNVAQLKEATLHFCFYK